MFWERSRRSCRCCAPMTPAMMRSGHQQASSWLCLHGCCTWFSVSLHPQPHHMTLSSTSCWSSSGVMDQQTCNFFSSRAMGVERALTGLHRQEMHRPIEATLPPGLRSSKPRTIIIIIVAAASSP